MASLAPPLSNPPPRGEVAARSADGGGLSARADPLRLASLGTSPQGGGTYEACRQALTTYFDRTARRAWEDLTSDAPVSRIRATVRAGRERMRGILLDWLPDDLRRTRVLDAGCGTGAFAVAAAQRGADVLAVDVAGGLIEVARERAGFLGHGSIEWLSGDMLDPTLGWFDHAVAMDSLIHYQPADIVSALAALAERTRASIVFTVAPRTPALAAMHRVGQFFPRSDRSPAIVPVAERRLRAALAVALPEWRVARAERVASGFYTSQAMELVRR